MPATEAQVTFFTPSGGIVLEAAVMLAVFVALLFLGSIVAPDAGLKGRYSKEK